MVELLNKAELRSQKLAERAAVPESVRRSFAARLAVVGPSLVRNDDDPTADPVISLYQSIRGEPDTHPLFDVLAKVGLTTALPVVTGRGEPLVFRVWRPGDPLEDGLWGTGHPPAAAAAVEPDVLFIPLAAFDRRGHRLGYGAGFYDRTLAVLRKTRVVRTIGVAFACQEVLFLPAEPHDEPLDVIVTERDTILCDG